ncbi:chemotaxis protein CheC [Fundidesulfovibrio butyratiphilus]
MRFMAQNTLLSDYQLDIFRELINIGMGKAAGLINQMVDSHVSLELPEVVILGGKDELAQRMGITPDAMLSTVRMGFKGELEGWSGLIFPRSSASWLVSRLIGDLDDASMDFDSLRIGAIQEVGNIVLNGVMGSIATMLEKSLDYFPPDYFETSVKGLFDINPDDDGIILVVKTRFLIEQGVAEGDIVVFFQVAAFDKLLAAMNALGGGGVC